MLPRWLCECFAPGTLETPSVEEVLRAIREHTVCTGAQCFASADDIMAGPLVQRDPAMTAASLALPLLLVAMALVALMRRPAPLLGAKPSASRQ